MCNSMAGADDGFSPFIQGASQRMKVALLAFLLLAAAGLPGRLDAAVREGMSRTEVIAEWGQPTGGFTTGGREVLMYPQGRRVELRGEEVIAVEGGAPDSPPPAGRRPASPARPEAERPSEVRDAQISITFAPVSRSHRRVPYLKAAWAETPQTDEMFLMGHRRGRDLPRLHSISGRRGLFDLQTTIDEGADLHKRDKVGRTALHRYAVYSIVMTPTLEMMQALLDGGAEVNARDRFGQTALHIAAQHQSRTTQFLLAAGADPNAVDWRGRTPLHLAAEQRNLRNKEILLAAGADPALTDAAGFTIADIERKQELWVSRQQFQGQTASLAYGLNGFVACSAFSPSILVSGDGTRWRDQPAPHSMGLRSVAAVRDGFVGYGTSRHIYWSDDGVSWEEVHLGREMLPMKFAAASPERVVMMGKPATVMHSADGRSWESLPDGLFPHIVGLDWAGDHFLALNREGILLYSPDGLNWKGAQLNLQGLTLKRMRRVNGYWYGLGYYGLMIRSQNGIDWEHVPTDTLQPINDIAWGNGLFVAVGGRGLILVSEDGWEWRHRRSAETADFLTVAFGADTFVAISRPAIWTRHHAP